MSSHQQLLYHIVFSTKERRLLLRDDRFRESVWRYMAGVASNLEGHALRIGGYYDHAHLLVRIPAKISVADFVRQLKANSSKHINEENNSILKFHWQDGYGAFTVSRESFQSRCGIGLHRRSIGTPSQTNISRGVLEDACRS